jgi:hypothetical protein
MVRSDRVDVTLPVVLRELCLGATAAHKMAEEPLFGTFTNDMSTRIEQTRRCLTTGERSGPE